MSTKFTEVTDSTKATEPTRVTENTKHFDPNKHGEPVKSRKFKIPLRVQFLIIALSLAITSTILGLSTYLTDTDTYQGTFRTASGDELGFRLTRTEHTDELVTPGDTITLNAVAKIKKATDLYLFVKLDIPSDFTLVGLNTTEWHPISEGSNIYYLGSGGTLLPLGTENGSSSRNLDGITLSTEAVGGSSYTVTITGYAIQADNISPSSPASVFGLIGGQ